MLKSLSVSIWEVCVCVCAFWITQVLYVCLFFREENMWPPISKRRQKLTLMSKPGCTPGLSPEGHIVDINPFFSPRAR